MGKRLTAEDKLEVLKLLKEGNTSEQCAEAMGVSAPTINNLRAQFKSEGETFPNNRGRKKLDANKVLSPAKKVIAGAPVSSESIDYDYLINGIKIKFTAQPKTVRIGKNRFYVEF
jgi:transposase-like protein